MTEVTSDRMQYMKSAKRLEDRTRALSWKWRVLLPLVIAMVSLASLSSIVLSAGSSDILISSAKFTSSGLDHSVAATAGLLIAMTSIWLSVPISSIVLAFYERARNDWRVGI